MLNSSEGTPHGYWTSAEKHDVTLLPQSLWVGNCERGVARASRVGAAASREACAARAYMCCTRLHVLHVLICAARAYMCFARPAASHRQPDACALLCYCALAISSRLTACMCIVCA